jgi:peptide/nickel transport system permease protein
VTSALGFLLRRSAVGAGLLVLLALVSFVLFYAVPTEPAAFLLDMRHASPEDIANARAALGVDSSVWSQFTAYLGRLAHGDLGYSWSAVQRTPDGDVSGMPVGPTVLDAARVTGALALGGMVFLAIVAVPLGVAAARRPNSLFDRLTAAFSTSAIAIHPLVLALVLQLFVARHWGVLPEKGYCSLLGSDTLSEFGPQGLVERPCGGPADWAQHLILPWLTFGLFFTALYLRMTRSRMLDTLQEPYIRTARAKGASEGRVLRGHALRNGLPPLVTMAGMDIGLAVGMAVFVESVFGLPGLGARTVQALNVDGVAFDLPLILGVVLAVGTAIVVLNLVVDAIQVLLDPRLRTG